MPMISVFFDFLGSSMGYGLRAYFGSCRMLATSIHSDKISLPGLFSSCS